MAGSYRHIINDANEFNGVELLDHLGDAYEALEECYDMIQFITGGDKRKIWEAHIAHCKKRYPHFDEKAKHATYEKYWEPCHD